MNSFTPLIYLIYYFNNNYYVFHVFHDQILLIVKVHGMFREINGGCGKERKKRDDGGVQEVVK